MVVKLYKMDLSPPVRAVMMACGIFNVPTEMIEVNLLEKDHLKPEFLKKNPVHTVPVLEDGDLILTDSHAILMYLADVYGNNDQWYPKDVTKRALVNQKLFFDATILFPRLRNITYALIIERAQSIPQKLLDQIDEAYSFMEQFLSDTQYIAGDEITIADLSAISDVTSLVHLVPINAEKYPKTLEWMKKMEEQPYCKEYNAPGAKEIGDVIKKIRDQFKI